MALPCIKRESSRLVLIRLFKRHRRLSGTHLMDKKKIQNLKVIYGIALVFIGLTVFLSALLMHNAIKRNQADSRVVNLSGRQRMLSQRITKGVLALAYTKDPEEQQRQLAILSKSLRDIQKVQLGLQYGDPKLGLPVRDNTPQIQELFAAVEPYHAKIVQALTTLLEKSRGPALDHGLLQRTIAVMFANEPPFLALMEKITFHFAEDAKKRINLLSHLQNSILVADLLVLVLIFLLVFRPTLKNLETSVGRLKDSEGRLRAITDTAGDAIILMDAKQAISYWNPAAEQMLGYASEEVVGKNLHELLVPQRYHAEYQAALPHFFHTGNGNAVGKVRSLFAIRKDGQEIAVSHSLSAFLLNGEWHSVGILRDITESLKQQEALKSSEENVRLLLNSAAEAICGIDLDGSSTFVNPAFLNMLGYTDLAQVIGKDVHQLTHHSYPDGSPFPVEACRLHRAIHEGLQVHLDNETLWRSDGSSFPAEVWTHPQITNDTLVGAVITFVDITERKKMEATLQQMAHFDVLTGLPNRALFSDRVQQALAEAKRNPTCLAIMFIDLDKFKPVNDNYGHAVGDLLLKEVANRMRGAVRESDTVARVGGDEFIVLLKDIKDGQDALVVAEKIRNSLNMPFILNNLTLGISSSIGIAVFPEHGSDEVELCKNADTAMYQAKENGRDAARLFQST